MESTSTLSDRSPFKNQSIRVAVRIRPIIPIDGIHSYSLIDCVPEKQLVTLKAEDPRGQNKQFSFDAVFDSNTNQDDIFDQSGVPELLRSVVDGYGATIFAYGQTGSGKTYTMEGFRYRPSNSRLDSGPRFRSGPVVDFNSTSPENLGIIPRCLENLFALIDKDKDRAYCVSCTFVQIYKELVYDLLSPAAVLPDHLFAQLNAAYGSGNLRSGSSPAPPSSAPFPSAPSPSMTPLRLRWNAVQGFHLENVYTVECSSAAAALHAYKVGVSGKAMRSHGMNASSSRSHALFTLKVRVSPRDCPHTFVEGRLALVDLAGCERVDRIIGGRGRDGRGGNTEASSWRNEEAVQGRNNSNKGNDVSLKQESVAINKSLFTLRKVITALAARSTQGRGVSQEKGDDDDDFFTDDDDGDDGNGDDDEDDNDDDDGGEEGREGDVEGKEGEGKEDKENKALLKQQRREQKWRERDQRRRKRRMDKMAEKMKNRHAASVAALITEGRGGSSLGGGGGVAMHIPYRDSKLTCLLQPSLGGSSRCLMLACLSPSDLNFEDNLSTLMYASRARRVVNQVVVNEDPQSKLIRELRAEIALLRRQLAVITAAAAATTTGSVAGGGGGGMDSGGKGTGGGSVSGGVGDFGAGKVAGRGRGIGDVNGSGKGGIASAVTAAITSTTTIPTSIPPTTDTITATTPATTSSGNSSHTESLLLTSSTQSSDPFAAIASSPFAAGAPMERAGKLLVENLAEKLVSYAELLGSLSQTHRDLRSMYDSAVHKCESAKVEVNGLSEENAVLRDRLALLEGLAFSASPSPSWEMTNKKNGISSSSGGMTNHQLTNGGSTGASGDGDVAARAMVPYTANTLSLMELMDLRKENALLHEQLKQARQGAPMHPLPHRSSSSSSSSPSPSGASPLPAYSNSTALLAGGVLTASPPLPPTHLSSVFAFTSSPTSSSHANSAVRSSSAASSTASSAAMVKGLRRTSSPVVVAAAAAATNPFVPPSVIDAVAASGSKLPGRVLSSKPPSSAGSSHHSVSRSKSQSARSKPSSTSPSVEPNESFGNGTGRGGGGGRGGGRGGEKGGSESGEGPLGGRGGLILGGRDEGNLNSLYLPPSACRIVHQNDMDNTGSNLLLSRPESVPASLKSLGSGSETAMTTDAAAETLTRLISQRNKMSRDRLTATEEKYY